MIGDWDSNCRPVAIATEQEPSGTRKPERESKMRRTVPRKNCAASWAELGGENMQKMFCFLSRASALVALVIESSCLVSVFKTVTFESHLWSSLPN